jgi:ABC-2 type transport system ATP-binding protein
MKQRVCLARALLHDPPVLILDEPAAGLDPRARVELRELLRALAAQGKAILISSHILTELAEICSGAVIIEQGRILRAGSLDTIISEAQLTKKIVIRPLGSPEGLYRELMQLPHVSDVAIAGNEISLEFAGSEDEVCTLLSELIGRGHRLAEFRQPKSNLEEVFMSVTKGGVQ